MITPFAFNGCNFHNGEQAKEVRTFPEVTVPAMVNGREAAAEYAAIHFWDKYFEDIDRFKTDLDDTSSFLGGVAVPVMDRAVRDYVLTLWSIPEDKAEEAQRKLMELVLASLQEDTCGHIYGYFTRALETLLWNPLSDLRNETWYIPVVENILATGMLDGKNEDFYRYRLETCNLNSTGHPAADFTFTDSKGRLRTLYGISGEYTLVMFSNPGCPACREVVELLKSSPKANTMLDNGRLSLLSIYIDEDMEAWQKGLKDYPTDWVAGYDQDLRIRDGNLYGIRAIPSLYLLDREKKVLLKDVSPGLLMLRLESL